MFKGCDWKGKRLWCCQSRMLLWVSLNFGSYIGATDSRLDRAHYRKVLREIILDFPEDTGGCRCRDCRFFRIYGPKTTSLSPPKGA